MSKLHISAEHWARPGLLRRWVALILLESALLTACSRVPDAVPYPRYKLERVLRFHGGGPSDKFLADGWGKPERFFTWTTGHSANLRFSLPPVEGPLGLRMRLEGITKNPELPWQPVEVWINGQLITAWEVEKTFNFYAVFPSELIRDDGSLDVQLKIPQATSPKALGFNNDERVLGVACSEVEIAKAVPINATWHSVPSPRLSVGR